MKRIAWKRVVLVLGGIALTAYLVWVLIFTEKESSKIPLIKLEVEVLNRNVAGFVNSKDIEGIVLATKLVKLNTPIKELRLDSISRVLNSKSYIKDVNVYTTGDGCLHIKLQQRCPVVRINPEGKTPFYMDASGFVFPLCNYYSHRVPIVTGNVILPFRDGYKGELPSVRESHNLKELLLFIEYLSDDKYWGAEIKQINISKEYGVEIITCTGNHLVILGNFNSYKEKLDRLKVFYKKVLLTEGWDKYQKIDLRFNKQVVVTPSKL